jgi:hypothetical protein
LAVPCGKSFSSSAEHRTRARASRLAAEAADFVEDHMGYAKGCADLLAAALAKVNPTLGGLYCEFGGQATSQLV